jgi:hypothetical protein
VPGTGLIIQTDPSTPLRSRYEGRLEWASDVKTEEISSGPGFLLEFTRDTEYPYLVFRANDHIALLEGLIYNKSDAQIGEEIQAIAEAALNESRGNRLVKQFVLSSDGDYVVTLLRPGDRLGIVFNDRWARLPLYGYRDRNRFALNREAARLLERLPRIAVDRSAIAEWLAFEYTLDGRFWIDGIRRVRPASVFRIEWGCDGVDVAEGLLEEGGVSNAGPPLTRRRAVEEAAWRFTEGLDRRVRRLDELGFGITVDLSGGMDTRAVFLALCARAGSEQYEPCTEALPTGDESEIARALAQQYGTPLTRTESPPPSLESPILQDLVFEIDGTVNVDTALGSYFLARARRERISGRTARFMGFGGEFIRHPYASHWGYASLDRALVDEVYTRYVPLGDACSLLDIGIDDLQTQFASVISGFPESTKNDQVKRLYFTYYTGLVNAGEDRHRRLFWTVSPLWSDAFVDLALRQIDPAQIDTHFFMDVLLEIDPDAFRVPLYGRTIPSTAPLSRLVSSGVGHAKNRMRYDRILRKLRRSIGIRRTLPRVEPHERGWLVEQIRQVSTGSPLIRNIYNRKAIEEWLDRAHPKQHMYQVLTSMLYLAELERRFPGADVAN